MKILAIRVKNLASLSGRTHEIDFTREPLAGSGLFAITGPTGAGKSTVLDALCLALFDATPRLDGTGGAKIGREDDEERLVASDVRALMSRGAADAMAEVDFVGRDGERWRATWTVARARAKASGKVQKQNVSLKNLDTGQLAGGTKTETLSAIEEKLGLTFDQFRKSVLLAQGDFADFLKAPADERSALLQRLTGTEIYEGISRAAHERAREAKERLKELEARRESITVLDETARAALEAEIEGAEGRVKSLEAGEKTLEELSRTAARVREAAGEAGRLVEAAGRAERDAAEAEARKERAALSLAEAVGALEAVRAEHDRIKPEVDRARQLDATVEAAEGELAAAREKARTASAALDEAVTAHAAAEAARQAAEAALAAAESWLAENEGSKELAERWQVVDDNLAELARIENERKEAAAREAREAAALERAVIAEKKIAEDVARQESILKQATDARGAAQEELSKIPVAGKRVRLDELSGLDRGLASLADIPGRARKAEWEAQEAFAEAVTSRASASKAASERDAAANAREEAAVRLSEARSSLEAASAALGLAERRDELKVGEPCPLCGSTEHPWASGGAPGETLVKQLRERVTELLGVHERHVQAHARAATAVEKETALAGAADKRAAQWREEGEKLAVAWRSAVGELPPLVTKDGARLPADPLPREADRVVAALVAEVRSESDSIREILGEAVRQEEKARKAREEEDLLTAQRDRCRADHQRALETARGSESRLEKARAEVEGLGGKIGVHVGQLQFLLGRRPELRERVAAGPEEVRQELQAEASAYRKKGDELASLRTGLNVADRKAAEAGAALAPRRDQAEAADREEAQKKGLLGEQQRGRGALLGGRTVADVEAAHRARQAESEEALARARTSASAAAETASSARTASGLAAARAAEASETSRTAAGKLDAERAAAGVPADEGAAEKALAEAVEALGRARVEAEARRTSRHRDDEARKALKELTSEAKAHGARSAVWIQLGELIGSHDGKKFRNFVQSLTLDALVQETNHHLRELAGRYRLERVPGADMDLQVVDSVLGDERRPVQSLSGGETFLVSLALALGLSSLATQRTRVETLFVDEGFGTLDADTLDKALSALEALQASGRRVGIISHVAALTERIGTRVVVTPKGAGRSEVSVVGV